MGKRFRDAASCRGCGAKVASESFLKDGLCLVCQKNGPPPPPRRVEPKCGSCGGRGFLTIDGQQFPCGICSPIYSDGTPREP